MGTLPDLPCGSDPRLRGAGGIGFYHDLFAQAEAGVDIPCASHGFIVTEEVGLRQADRETAYRIAYLGLAALAANVEHISPFSWASDASDELNNLVRVCGVAILQPHLG